MTRSRRPLQRPKLAKCPRLAPKGSFNYWLPAGTKIQRSRSRTTLPGMPWGWEDFTTTREALFTEDDLVLSPINDMTVVRIPNMSDGGVRSDGWQSIQFDFLQLKRVINVKQYEAETY